MKKTIGSHAFLAEDVLHISIYSSLNVDTLRSACALADGACHALLFDVTGALTADTTTVELARVWRDHVPARPTALVHLQEHAAFWYVLMMRLASVPIYPAPLQAFTPIERMHAVTWCHERAITYRDTLSRRRS